MVGSVIKMREGVMEFLNSQQKTCRLLIDWGSVLTSWPPVPGSILGTGPSLEFFKN